MLSRLDPSNSDARKIRAVATRALGQRTTYANVRGFSVTEALQNEARLLLKGQPVSLNAVRGMLGAPTVDQLMEAEPAANFEFIRYLVDPRKAEGKNLSFTIAVGNDRRLTQIRLRNCVMILSNVNSKGGTHVDVSRRELAEFVRGLHSIAAGNNVLADFENAPGSQPSDPETSDNADRRSEVHRRG